MSFVDLAGSERLKDSKSEGVFVCVCDRAWVSVYSYTYEIVREAARSDKGV